MLNIGLRSAVNDQHIVSILPYGTNPSKRMVNDAKENGTLVDGTAGRKTLSVIVMDSGHVITSATTPEKLNERMEALK